MAKKKKSTKKKSGKKSSRKSGGLFDTNKLIGQAATAFGHNQLQKIKFFANLDPKMQGAAKILLGDWIPKQSIVNSVGNPVMRQAAGDALMYEGVKELMSSFGIAGVGNLKRKVRGNEFLAVSIEGLDDVASVNEDVVNDDLLNSDDLNAVNDDGMDDDGMDDDGMDDNGMDDDSLNDDLEV